MEIEPGWHNWTQPVDTSSKLVDRMRRESLFYFTSDLMDWIDSAGELESIDEADLWEQLSDEDRVLADEIADDRGLTVRLRPAGVGRGASGIGVAIQVLEQIGSVGGGAVLVVQTARAVRAAYRRLARRRGLRPLVSLGAAEHLAAADLADRLGHNEFVLMGSGDVNSVNYDRDFTGGDAFFVIIRADDRLHHFHVSAYGEVHYIGDSPDVRSYMDDPPAWTDDDAP